MSKISCDVIKDLLPLYIDEVVSEDTKILVEEHIAECDECREVLLHMAEEVAIPVSKDAGQEEIAFITRVKDTIRKKNVRTAFVTAVISAVVIIGVYCLMCFPTKVIPYEEGLIDISVKDGKVYAQFAGDNYDGAYMFSEPVTIEEDGRDGTKKIIVAMYYDQSLYSKFIDPIIRPDKEVDVFCLNDGYGTTINGKEVHVDEELVAVYYSPEKIDIRSMAGSGESWTDNLDELELIWHK